MVEAEIRSLMELGQLKDAASAIDKLSNPPAALKVARVQLEERIEGSFRVRSQAELLLRDNLSAGQRAICYEVIGRASMSSGQTDFGMKAMRKAMALAAEAESIELEARVAVSNAESLIHWVAVEPAVEEVPRVRRLCVAAGDAFSFIIFHKVVAEIRAKQGLPIAARQSVQAARSLLNGWPNVWLQGRLAVTACGVEMTYADYESALSYAQEAMQCAEKAGSRDLLVPALGNLAHLKLVKGQLSEALKAIKTVQGLMHVGGLTEIASRDTEMDIALAAGDLERAKALSEEISTILAKRKDTRSYHGLWNTLTQARLLFRLSQPRAGLEMAREALPYVEPTDRNLSERMQLLVAEGLGRIGQSQGGATVLAAAVKTNADPALELIGERCRVSGLLIADEEPKAALAQFNRAAQVFETLGHLTAHANVQRDVQELAPQFALAPSTAPIADASTTAAVMSEQIATMLEFGAHPLLLATEALKLLGDTNCVSYAAVLKSRIGHDLEEQTVSEVRAPETGLHGSQQTATARMIVGQHSEWEYKVVACPRPTAGARSTLLSVETLVHHSVAIARSRIDRREQAAFWPEETVREEFGLVCASERMLDLIKTLRRVADSNLTVLITGETGVGKELFARALHQASPRQSKSFFPFNCTAVPREMLDSQLFGHRRGAFTGALEEGKGVIRAAAGGTLFLDEIGEMSMEAQPKLLRFLESGEILPLGESKTEEVDVRIVAATNADLEKLVTEGRFREDLYYRLNVLPIHIPPLRERREEIPALVEHFLEKYGRELQKPMLRVADDTLEYLLLYRWPGNVRQLANEIRRMAALAEPAQVLQPAHLSKDIIASRRTIPLQPSEAVLPLDQPLAAAVEQVERAVIERALKVCNGRNDEAAKALGMSRKGLYLKRQRLGV